MIRLAVLGAVVLVAAALVFAWHHRNDETDGDTYRGLLKALTIMVIGLLMAGLAWLAFRVADLAS